MVALERQAKCLPLQCERCRLLADFVAEVGHFGWEVPTSVFLKRPLIALL
jgi:hypothetical protein